MINTADTSIRAQDFSSSVSISRKERIINLFALCTQFFVWPILALIFHSFFVIRIIGRENIKNTRSPFLIVANHIAFYDSFLFRLILGVFSPHLPLRFMGVKNFKWKGLNVLSTIGLIDFLYGFFGVFTVVPGQGISRNLFEAKEILKVGGNVVIYPEGTINPTDGIAPFKKGAAVLIKVMRVPAIPVTFRKGPKVGIRREISISVGKELHFSNSLSVESITRELHDHMLAQYKHLVS